MGPRQAAHNQPTEQLKQELLLASTPSVPGKDPDPHKPLPLNQAFPAAAAEEAAGADLARHSTALAARPFPSPIPASLPSPPLPLKPRC